MSDDNTPPPSPDDERPDPSDAEVIDLDEEEVVARKIAGTSPYRLNSLDRARLLGKGAESEVGKTMRRLTAQMKQTRSPLTSLTEKSSPIADSLKLQESKRPDYGEMFDEMARKSREAAEQRAEELQRQIDTVAYLEGIDTSLRQQAEEGAQTRLITQATYEAAVATLVVTLVVGVAALTGSVWATAGAALLGVVAAATWWVLLRRRTTRG